MKKFDRSFWINASFLAIFIGLIAYASIAYAPDITRLISNPEKFRVFILSFGRISALIFMLFQVLQVVIAIIPGELVQVAGGYIFGIFWGTLFSLVGITAGYIIVFSLVRVLGYRVVRQLVSKNDLQKFCKLINSPGSEMTLFLLFFIPGIPKDILVYIAGLTPINSLQFFIIITIARFPAMLGASIIGWNIQHEYYLMAVILSVVSCILFIVGYIFKDRILSAIKEVSPKNGIYRIILQNTKIGGTNKPKL